MVFMQNINFFIENKFLSLIEKYFNLFSYHILMALYFFLLKCIKSGLLLPICYIFLHVV